MNIRKDSKKIVQMLLECAVQQEDLFIDFEIDYDRIAADLGLESASYCKICFMYLANSGFLIPYKEAGRIEIRVSAVDFLEGA